MPWASESIAGDTETTRFFACHRIQLQAINRQCAKETIAMKRFRHSPHYCPEELLRRGWFLANLSLLDEMAFI